MTDTLECPGSGSNAPNWAQELYLYRASDINSRRPIFTGDVFFDVEVQGVGAIEQKNVIVIQHPCALRSNGIDLTDTLMLAEVVPHRLLQPSEWTGFARLMPLPELVTNDPQDSWAAQFTSCYLAIPDSLALDKRVACMTLPGVNLLMQRWVFHNSRVVVPTWKYDEAVNAQYEEADGIEEWCDIRTGQGIKVVEAAAEANQWLNEDITGGIKRRRLLEDPQYRSSVRKEMRKRPKELNAAQQQARRPSAG